MRLWKGIACALALWPTAAAAQATVGVVAPLSGPSAILGEQLRTGAATAAAGDTGVTLQVVDDACTAAGGKAAAENLAAARVSVVVGFLCTESIEAALPVLKEAGIPVIAVGVRTDSLTDRRRKTGWPVFRLGPRSDGEREAAARLITALWADNLFAIVDDGTIYAREMAESVRLAAEQARLKPVFVDTFRPQLDNQIGLIGRLRKAGATHVFAAGDRDDVAIMTRDATELAAGIVFASGETLRAPPGGVPLAVGTLMIALPEWAEVAPPAVGAAFQAAGVIPEGYAVPAYAAVEIAREAIAQAASGGTVTEKLAADRFETAIGPVRFDDKGDLTDNPYRVFRFDGTNFVPFETE